MLLSALSSATLIAMAHVPAANATSRPTMLPIGNINLGYETKVDAELQQQIEAIDDELRTGFGMTALQTVASVLDLNAGRVSMI